MKQTLQYSIPYRCLQAIGVLSQIQEFAPFHVHRFDLRIDWIALSSIQREVGCEID